MTGAIPLEGRPLFFAWRDTAADALMTGWFGWDVLHPDTRPTLGPAPIDVSDHGDLFIVSASGRGLGRLRPAPYLTALALPGGFLRPMRAARL